MRKFSGFLIFLFGFSLCLFDYQGCSNPAGPNNNLQQGRRDYIWTVDTLNLPYNMLAYIWGSSPTDVWVVGPGGDLDKTIYHFTGEKWLNDGIARPLSPQSVFGFSTNDVWFGSRGFDSSISFWHYDGKSISKFQDLNIPNYPIGGIQGIWGDSPNNIYATGYASNKNDTFRGIIQHFDGSLWQTVYISPRVNPYENLAKIYKSISFGYVGERYYVLGSCGFNRDTTMIYEFAGDSLNEIYASDWSFGKQAEMALISNEVYFILGDKVCTRPNNSFQTLFYAPGSNYLLEIGGRNREDILLFMSDGIAHYNGNDIQYLYHFVHSSINSYCAPIIFEKEVFFLAFDFQNNLNLIFRGKLNSLIKEGIKS